MPVFPELAPGEQRRTIHGNDDGEKKDRDGSVLLL